MRIVQITDMHRGGGGEYSAGVDVDANYRIALEFIRTVRPDAIVCTGDVVCSAADSGAATEMLREWTGICKEVHVVPGNHDDAEALDSAVAQVTCRPRRLPYLITAGPATLAFVDTSNGLFAPEDMAFLRRANQTCGEDDTHLLVFMHHPPCTVGCDYLDRYVGLRNLEESERMLESLDHECSVFCGHFHRCAEVDIGNGTVYMTGATSFTVPCDSETFAIEHTDPYVRVIDVEGDSLSPTVHRLQT